MEQERFFTFQIAGPSKDEGGGERERETTSNSKVLLNIITFAFLYHLSSNLINQDLDFFI